MSAQRFLTSLALAAIAAGASARAQQPAPSPSPPMRVPVFPGGVEQVVVDVVVVDGKGQALPGLTAADFTLTEEGAAREILSFESVAPEDPAADATRPDRARLMRAFALVFDDLHLTITAGDRVKDALRELITGVLRDTDEVALLRTSTGQTWSGRVGTDRALLLAAIENMRGLRSPPKACDMSDEEAMQIGANRDIEALNVVYDRFVKCGLLQRQPQIILNPSSPPPEGPGAPRRSTSDKPGSALVQTLATDQYQQSLNGIRATYTALESLLRALAPLRGRKSVILASEGFVRDRGMVEVKGVVTAASDANAAVYFLDARTLTDRALTRSADGSAMPDRLALGRVQQGRFLGAEASELLATETGGTIIRGHDLGRGLQRLADESRSYYLLGYSPRNAGLDGKFRAIRVDVKRPGVTVRARRGYYAVQRAGAPPANVAVTTPARPLPDAPPALPDAGAAYAGDGGATRARVAEWSSEQAQKAVAGLKASNASDDVVETAALAHAAAALAADPPPEHQAKAAQEAAALVRDAARRGALERRVLLGLANRFLEARDWEEAQNLAQEATERNAEDADALLALGIVQETTGSVVNGGRRPAPDQSILTAGFDEMMARNPVTGFAAGVPGRATAPAQNPMSRPGALTAEARLRRAAETYRRALKARPGLAEARLRLGRTLALLGESQPAAQELQAAAADASPDVAYLARLFLGDLREQQGDLAGAVTEYRAAVAARPGSAVAQLAVARAQQAVGDREGAQAAIDSWLLAPAADTHGDPWWRYRLRPLGRWADALAEAR